MPGYVNIGGVWLPESSKPSGEFRCNICGTELTRNQYERHVARCFSDKEEKVRMAPIAARLPDLYRKHDIEREDWLKTPAGREWFRRNVENPG